MRSFAGAFPELAFDLALELRATGRADLARELEASTVKTVSWDPDTNTALVALEPQRETSSGRSSARPSSSPAHPMRRCNWIISAASSR